ncbi:GNAT family N-acetyltransferase [Cytobacillus sp. FJAT-54145]|uniref:GNAT family N-acetyltransferase n=1 Tax=Cytobacillus spartinae TaxID=3299023 RepID=A0ABW6KHG3_9BACI
MCEFAKQHNWFILPRWDCDIKNVGSIKLAEKLGFHTPREYGVYSLEHVN